MLLSAWATLAVLGVYFWTWANAARARMRYQVPAPSMDGPEGFQRSHRVLMYTLEQLPLVLGPMWLCALFLGDIWGAAGAMLWCLGRILYALGSPRSGQARGRFHSWHACLRSTGLWRGCGTIAALALKKCKERSTKFPYGNKLGC
jgi:glutathione S-transferase